MTAQETLREIQRITMPLHGRKLSLEARQCYALATQAIANEAGRVADDRIDDADFYSRESRFAEQHLGALSPERIALLNAEWPAAEGYMS